MARARWRWALAGFHAACRSPDGTGTLEVPGGRLRVLMVISRPAGTADVGYQMVARPLLERLDAVRGEVDLTVLRPPTFDALSRCGEGRPRMLASRFMWCISMGTALCAAGRAAGRSSGAVRR